MNLMQSAHPPLRSLYNAQNSASFCAEVLGETALYEYAIPCRQSISTLPKPAGTRLANLHNSSFAITLMFSPSERAVS